MKPFINVAFNCINCETSNKFDVRQESTYISALAFEKYNKLQFVDKTSGNVHYELDFIMVDTCQENPLDEPIYAAWNQDGTRFFFLGYVDPIHDLHNFKERWKRWALVFVVLDVANKTILKTYNPNVKNPHWNAEGTEVLFGNQPTEIVDFDDFITEKTEDYAFGLSFTFKKALNGKPIVEDAYDEDLIPLGFMEGREIQLSMTSFSGSLCVRCYSLPTSPNEPLRMTFTVFQKYNDKWHPIYDLPHNYYLEDGIDYLAWGTGLDILAFSVNHFKEVFVLDLPNNKTSHCEVPQDTIKTYWNAIESEWVFKSANGFTKCRLSDDCLNAPLVLQWKNKVVQLSTLSTEPKATSSPYKVSFYSLEEDLTVAVCPVYSVVCPETVKILEDGWVTFQAYDMDYTRQFIVYCDLTTFGTEKKLRIGSWELPLIPERIDWDEKQRRWQPIIHGHRVVRHQLLDKNDIYDLPVMAMDSSVSPFFEVVKHEEMYDDFFDVYSENSEWFVWFINNETKQIQMEYKGQIEGKAIWDQGRTKCFFNIKNGEMFFMVLDVMNKTELKKYYGFAENPRWNEDGTQVLFDNTLELYADVLERRQKKKEMEMMRRRQEKERLEREKTEAAKRYIPEGPIFHLLPSPDGIHAIYLRRRDRKSNEEPNIYDFHIIDKRMGIIVVTGFKHPVEELDSIKQLPNGRVTYYATDFSIVSFNLNDLFNNAKLKVSVRDIPRHPERYDWTDVPENGHWEAIIDGIPFAPRPFYYDHLRYENIVELPILYFRHEVGPLFEKVNFNASNRYQVTKTKKEVDSFGLNEWKSLDFIDRENGAVHYSIKFCIDGVFNGNDPVMHPVYKMWNKDGTKYFFSGHALPEYEFVNSMLQSNQHGHLLVVVDVEHGEIMDIYKFAPTDPHWNDAGDKVVFTHPLERNEACLAEAKEGMHQREPLVPIDTQLVVCTTEVPDKPDMFEVCIMDSEHKHCYVRLPYLVNSKFAAIRQAGSIVCYYAPVAPGATTFCIVRFDMQDIHSHKELVFNVWDLHSTPTGYEWDSKAAQLWPVINGTSIRPGRFYYDDQYMQSVKIMR